MRRGGVLFEIMLAIALFVGAAAFALGATRSTLRNLDHSLRQQQAIDLARSKFAELEAGMVGLGDLQGRPIQRIGSIEQFNQTGSGPQWIVELRTERTEHGPLTLVELTVREDIYADQAARYTIRKLMRLRDEHVEEYEEDDLLEGLPR